MRADQGRHALDSRSEIFRIEVRVDRSGELRITVAIIDMAGHRQQPDLCRRPRHTRIGE
jgi:hypothetical protein